MEENPRKPRRWFQYSLRTLLILTTVVAALFAWWSDRGRQQRAAVAAIKVAGGNITYDFEAQNFSAPRRWPVWLVNRLGVDYFAHVVMVHFGASGATNNDLKRLGSLVGLRSLDLHETSVTDAGLEQLSLTALQFLDLRHTKVTDAGLEQLKELRTLQYLSLGGTRVTDVGVAGLQAALPNCKIDR